MTPTRCRRWAITFAPVGGYDTYYKGKWHVSHADILIPGTYDQLLSFNDQGERDPARERTYLNANRLDGFGFDG